MKHYLNWTVGSCRSAQHQPSRMIKASVPGCVQLDFAAADNYMDYTVADNFHQFDWMEDMFFLYEAELPKNSAKGERVVLKGGGIDYKYDIFIDEKKIMSNEGMFSPILIDITAYENAEKIKILIHPIPKAEGEEKGRAEANQSCKPPVSYGWDFHPRLVPSGIWEPLFLETYIGAYFIDCSQEIFLSDDLSCAKIKGKAILANSEHDAVVFKIISPTGEVIFRTEEKTHNGIAEFATEINHPLLWWPNGYGEQNLYTFVTRLAEGEHEIMQKRGVRKITLEVYEDGWKELSGVPTTCNSPPTTFTINGRAIFAQGTNWVCPEIFY